MAIIWNVLACLLFLLVLNLSSKKFIFNSPFFKLWECRLYDSEQVRYVLMRPFNWLITNDLRTGRIYVFGSSVYKCTSGQMPLYQFAQWPDRYSVSCWGGSMSSILKTIERERYFSIDIPVPTSERYCILNLINTLLDMGIITNQSSKTRSLAYSGWRAKE